jgi:hypothetical protein
MTGKSPMQTVIEDFIKMEVENTAENAIQSINEFLNKKNNEDW